MRGAKTGRRYSLRTLRLALGKTQGEVAQAACMTQGDARYVAALGGRVEVSVIINGRRYILDLDGLVQE